MPDSQDPKQVNNNDLRNAQFAGGLVNADKVIAGQIGGDTYNLVERQIVIEVGTTPQSKLPFLQREVFKPLIENRLALFGGRITVLTQITEFIKNSLSGYLVITAPAGFGKTSLMAKLVSEAPKTFAYHFFAPSISDHSITEEGFLKNVIQQMAQWHNYTDSLPEKLPDLKALYQSFLDEPLKHPHVLVIDGLDEVTDWNLTPYVSRRLPENLHIILTVRYVEQDWICDYDLPKGQTEHLPLNGLSIEDVADVLRAAGKQATILADNRKFIDEVMTVAAYQEEPSLGADPFYVRLLAEDAADGDLTPDNIANQPKGLEKYLDRWWDEIKKSAGEQRTKDLFSTLTVALGKMSRKDLEAINKDTLIDDWAVDFFDDVVKQVRRFVMGNEEEGYAIAHPRLRQHMRTKIKTEIYTRKILDFCTSWQEHYSLYALRYYAEHLRNAKQWNDLYILARNQTFAYIQSQQLPNEADLSLKTIQLALSCAAEENNAGLMAEFMIRHAHWIENVKKQDSLLKVLREEGLERVLKLIKVYEIERQLLWYLLLVWKLKLQNRLEEAEKILKDLEKLNLPRFERRGDADWQGRFAAYFLAQIFEINKDICQNLEQKLLNNHFRRHLCTYLKNLDNSFSFAIAIDIALKLNLDIHKISHLLDIAKAQAKIHDIEAAAVTFNKVVGIFHDSSPTGDWLDKMSMIENARSQLNNLGVKVFLNVDTQIAYEIINPEQEQQTLEFLKDEIQAENYPFEEASNKYNQLDKLMHLQYRLNVSKDFKTEVEKTEILVEISYLYADNKQYDIALTFSNKINNLHRRAEVQGFIAEAQAEEGYTSVSLDTFANILQTVQSHEQYETVFLQAIALAGIAEAQLKRTSKQVRIDTANTAYLIAQKINQQTQKAIALALVAEALAKTEKGYETTDIFNKATEIAHKVEIQGERVNAFKSVALSQAKIKDFVAAYKTAQNIEFSWTRAEVIERIVKLQAESGQKVEAEINLYNQSKNILSHFEAGRYINGKRINIICREAILKSFENSEVAQSIFTEALNFARESGNQRDVNLSTIVAAIAEAVDIVSALKIADEIEDGWEQVRAFSAIAWEKFDKKTTDYKEFEAILSATLEAKKKIKSEEELRKALQVIAMIQVLGGLGEQAVKTAETIVTERNWYLPRIASLFVITKDCNNFKHLLIPCAYYLDAAYHICEVLAHFYPEQAQEVAKVVSSLDLKA